MQAAVDRCTTTTNIAPQGSMGTRRPASTSTLDESRDQRAYPLNHGVRHLEPFGHRSLHPRYPSSKHEPTS